MNSVCPICKVDASDSDDKVELREKGSAGIEAASRERQDSITVNSGHCPQDMLTDLYQQTSNCSPFEEKPTRERIQ